MAWTEDDPSNGDGGKKAYFGVISTTQTAISANSNASSHVLGLTMEYSSPEWQLESDVGGVRNISGRAIEIQEGLVSSHTVSTNASDKLLSMFSERGTDKLAWTKNALSGRTETISGTSSSYGSKSSEAFTVLPNEIVRFKLFADGTGVSLNPVSLIADGDVVAGPAFRWRLREV